MKKSFKHQIAVIVAMSTTEKKAEWRRIFRSPPPPAYGAGLLARAITAHLQEKVFGGLTKGEVRSLTRSADEMLNNRARPAASRLEVGTRLSRTWHGHIHEVIVTRDGFVYRGSTYSSLSTVAKVITGTHWSGPRFFGLLSRRLIVGKKE